MKSCSIIALALVAPAAAFSGSSFTGSEMKTVKNSSTMSMEYIPSGMSKAQWEKIKNKEKATKKGNLGKVGITSFQSRTFAEWQKAGGKNLFPVDPNSVKSAKEIPYMQRQGGKPDDSDLKKGGGFFSMFNKKKPEPEPAPEPPKKKNPWTF